MAHTLNNHRTQDVRISQDVTFETMLLKTKTMEGLKKSNFFSPSPIQLHGIPLGKCGFDLLLEAKSGTGKTAVFTVITLEKLDLKKGLQSVILAPTREIAAQICDVIKLIGSQYEGLNIEVVMGGLPVQDDIEKFNKDVHVVVGSPGRLKHLIQDKHIDISSVRLVILDEADKLMEKSFLKDINYIFNTLPKEKQVIMSSATYPEEYKLIINKYVKNAQHICPDSTSILLGIVQKFTVVKYNTNVVRQTQYRFEELLKVLSRKTFKQCIIFCNYQARVAEVYKLLTREKWPAEQLYGQQDQEDRLDSLKTLQDYKCRILISTDLAARGIDASNVDLVINFEPPHVWQTYLHRIGRAGRFGSYGIAITILSEGKEFTKFHEMMNSMKINVIKLWSDECCDSTESSDISIKESSVLQPLTVDTVFNKSYDTLWQTLTCKNDDVGKITECFEKLCESFHEQKSQTVVESFSDLVISFTNKEVQPQTKMPFKTMKTVATSEIKEYLEDLYSTKNDESRFNTLVQSQNPGNSIVNNDLRERNECSNEMNNNNYSQYSSKCQFKEFTNNEKPETKFWKDKYLYADEDQKDLIKAGLPVAFSSGKNKNRNVNSKNYLNFTTSPDKEFCKNEKRNKNCKSKNKNYNSKPMYHNPDDYISEEEDNLYYSYCEKLRSKINQKKKHNSSRVSPQYNWESDFFQNNTPNLKKYEAWYHHLQLRVKQIEMAIYIQEMSKIKF